MGILARALGLVGLKLVRVPGVAARRLARRRKRSRNALVGEVTRSPGSAEAHLALARELLTQEAYFHAHAVARSGAMLAPPDDPAARLLVERTADALPDKLLVGHNRFHRLQALDNVLRRCGLRAGQSVLDVGGGAGELAAFIPEARYFLADKASNGIDGAAVPPELGQFDFVVSCHVLEHVPPGERSAFIDDLLRRARTAIILQNPFGRADDHETERLALIVDITGAAWAREHLECTLPTLDSIRAYAAERDLECETEPVGAITTAAAFVFVDHFARRARDQAALDRVNRFFNHRMCQAELSSQAPTGYNVVLTRRQPP